MGNLTAIFLVIVALLSALQGLFVMVSGTSVMHQILGALYWLIFLVAICTSMIISAIGEMTKRLPQPRARPAEPPPAGPLRPVQPPSK